MRINREDSVNFVLQDEGSVLRSDKAFATMWGISLSELVRFRGANLVMADLGELTREEAFEIHNSNWDQLELDYVARGLDYFLFDCSVACGRGSALRWVGLSLFGRDSGEASSKIVFMLRDLELERSALLISQVAFSRRRRHKAEPGWARHAASWTNRVNRVHKRALKMVGLFEQVALPIHAVS